MCSFAVKSIIGQSLTYNLQKFSIWPGNTQIRNKITINNPRLRNPFWFARKNRKVHEDYVTTENKSFLREALYDKFGAPAVIKGVHSFENSKSDLVKYEELQSVEWSQKFRRTGVIARKIGQYPLWLKSGEKVRTTLLQVVDNHVIKYIPPEEYTPTMEPRNMPNLTRRFGCLLVGAESTDPSLLTKEYCGLFKNSGVTPKKHLGRFFISPEARLLPGTPINVTHFRVGDYVDVRGKTVYRGFQGVVKRHGFKGMPASHGVTKTHRRPGNIGGGGEKGRVWPGTKMPGHMGNRWRTIKGLRIWRINTKYNVMWVQGSAIAGETNSLLYIYDTILPLRKFKSAPVFPTCLEHETTEPSPEDIWCEDIHNFNDSNITFTADNTTA